MSDRCIQLVSIVGTLRTICEPDGTPCSPVTLLFIEFRTFLNALFVPSPQSVSLSLEILASALLSKIQKCLQRFSSTSRAAVCSVLLLFIVFGWLLLIFAIKAGTTWVLLNLQNNAQQMTFANDESIKLIPVFGIMGFVILQLHTIEHMHTLKTVF